MVYPFGRCINCGKEFNSELRNEYNIAHCLWCGVEIDDFLKPENQIEHQDDIYCEECGQRIYERIGAGGCWLTVKGKEKQPGQCSGLCERELCGNCGDWDDEGCCPKCHEEKPQQCDKNPFTGREDERHCHCNNCGDKYNEG